MNEEQKIEADELTTALRQTVDDLISKGNSIAAISTVAVGCKIDGNTFAICASGLSGGVMFDVRREQS